MEGSEMKALRNTLIIILITLVMLEALLVIVDPIRFSEVQRDWSDLREHVVKRDNYYVFRPGTYDLVRYSVTINEDGTRNLPDNGSGCRVVAVGDSFTFGMGVDDNESWVNIAARETGYNWINSGMPGLQASNFVTILDEYPADVYVYLNTANDAAVYEEITPEQAPYRPFSALTLYIYRAANLPLVYEAPDNYRSYLDTITARDNLIWYTIDNSPQLDINIEYGAIVLPSTFEIIGVDDSHPNPTGHEQIWKTMENTLKPFVESYCESQ
jgi:hypothetical protein